MATPRLFFPQAYPNAKIKGWSKETEDSEISKAQIDLAEKLTKDGPVQYELHLKKAPKKEVVFTPEGKFVKEE